MNRFMKMLLPAIFLGISSLTVSASSGVYINDVGTGGTATEALDDAYANASYVCTQDFNGYPGGYTIVTLAQYPGFWWAEIDMYCSLS